MNLGGENGTLFSYAPHSTLKLELWGGWFSGVFEVGGKMASASSERSSLHQESAGSVWFVSFESDPFQAQSSPGCMPPSLALLSLSFGLCDPLSPGLERPSLPILDNCESLLIGLQRKRITWAHNDVMARGPSPPPPLPSLPFLLTSPPLKPNPHQPQMSLKPPT